MSCKPGATLLAGSFSSRVNAEERERRPGLSGVVATGSGKVGRARAAQQADSRIAQRGHHLRAGASADLGAVFVKGDIAHPMRLVRVRLVLDSLSANKSSTNARRCGDVARTSAARTWAQNGSIEVTSPCRSRCWRAMLVRAVPTEDIKAVFGAIPHHGDKGAAGERWTPPDVMSARAAAAEPAPSSITEDAMQQAARCCR